MFWYPAELIFFSNMESSLQNEKKKKKTRFCYMNRFTSLKHVQHFDAQEEIERKNIRFTTFQRSCSITKDFENSMSAV